MLLFLALGCMKPGNAVPAMPEPPPPLVVPDTEPVREAVSSRFVSGCVLSDQQILVLGDPSDFFGNRYLGIELATGATLWQRAAELVQCHEQGVVFADLAGMSVVDGHTGEPVARYDIALPAPEGAECNTLFVEPWPDEAGPGFAFSRVPSMTYGAPPTPEWEARTKCCVSGRVSLVGGGPQIDVTNTASGTSVICAALSVPVAPELTFEAALPDGGVRLETATDTQLVRVDGEGQVVWSRPFSRPEPPP